MFNRSEYDRIIVHADRSMEILVIGSSNTDMVVRAPRLPVAGETILGGQFRMVPGGKGANQAVAVVRLGGSVRFVAKLGDDLFGRQTLAGLREENIPGDYISIDPEFPSGVALITVDERGENSIVVAGGANTRLTETDIDRSLPALESAEIILLQLEIPLQTVEYAARLAREFGKTVILDPAPACPLPDSLLQTVTILTPNQTEAELLTGIAVNSPETARKAAIELRARGVANVIITLGSEGAYLYNGEIDRRIPGFPVEAVDTTAAGDTFNGALAVALAEGKDLVTAIAFAHRAASIAVTRPGARSSIPYRREIAF
ncbi:ribokinase [Pannus brasiliensis CCIBt3594]|uniref:Ribokinase n=1 Tax=Pannus brasiliensis CCIBt3594 TaxID=1427578 RepID=A0AAW9QR34_9CHRO